MSVVSTHTPVAPVQATNLVWLFRLLLSFNPALLLLLTSLRTEGTLQKQLALGALSLAAIAGYGLILRQSWREPYRLSLALHHVIGLAWLWLCWQQQREWSYALAQAVLMITPLLLLSVRLLRQSGAVEERHARLLAEKLEKQSTLLPMEWAKSRAWPEVQQFRAALEKIDAAPALALLGRRRAPGLRLAALCALEMRKRWQPAQVEIVLKLAQQTQEPALQAAAALALAYVHEQVQVESLACFLLRPHQEVRQSATQALFWDGAKRWTWIRHQVRAMLADDAFVADGPIAYEGAGLTREAIADLTAWCAEKGALSVRAAKTLRHHYARVLQRCPGDDLVVQLREWVTNPQAPPVLRMELATLLHASQDFDEPTLRRLLSESTPAPLRLVAIDVLLAKGSHPEALACLRYLAGMANRELALLSAEIVQNRLGIDMGLAQGEPLPATNTRQAADVTRRAMAWSQQSMLAAAPEATNRPALAQMHQASDW